MMSDWSNDPRRDPQIWVQIPVSPLGIYAASWLCVVDLTRLPGSFVWNSYFGALLLFGTWIMLLFLQKEIKF